MLTLTETERAIRNALLKKWGYDLLIDLEEDCSGARSYWYEVQPSNICDCVYLCFKDHKELITDISNF